jgi:hypothetical protein
MKSFIGFVPGRGEVFAQHLQRRLGEEGQLVGDLLAVVPAQLPRRAVDGVLKMHRILTDVR